MSPDQVFVIVMGSRQLADLQARLTEMEERLDFTERVLLQERQAGQLRQGDGG